MFGGTINTNVFYITLLPIINLVILACSDDPDNDEPIQEKKTTFWSRIGKICSTILNVLLMLYIIYQLYKNIYILFVYHYLATIAMLGILSLSKRLTNFIKQGNVKSKLVSIFYGIILITTLLYLILLNPCKVKDANVIVQNSGFINVSYRDNIKSKKMLTVLLDTEVTEGLKYEDGYGYYLFTGEIEEKDYAIFVSVTRGTIVTFTEVKANTTLKYIIDK